MATDSPPFILGLGGTTREGSTSEVALGFALRVAEGMGARTRLLGGGFLASLPLYAPEAQVRTPQEIELVETIRSADGLIVATPGYHGGVSGIVKNAIDLIEETSRDPRVYLEGRAVGLIVTAAGWQATGTTLTSMRSIVHSLRGWPTPLGVTLNSMTPVFGADGEPREPGAAQALTIMARQVVQFALWQRSL